MNENIIKYMSFPTNVEFFQGIFLNARLICAHDMPKAILHIRIFLFSLIKKHSIKKNKPTRAISVNTFLQKRYKRGRK